MDRKGNVSPFSGMLYCSGCGYKMKKGEMRYKDHAPIIIFSCGYHARFGKDHCTPHTIRETDLEAIVIADIQSKLRLIVDEDKARKQFLAKKTGIRSLQGLNDKKRRQEIDRRLSELDTLIQSAYENMVLGKVPEDVCIKLIEKYQTESKQLQAELDTIMERLSSIHQDEHDVDEFIRRLKKYAGFEKLTREMLMELVEYITIDDTPRNRNEPRTVHILL